MAHRDGPHAALVTMWLLLRGAIEASAVDPEVMLVGTVEVAAAMLDDAGPEGIVEFLGADVDQATGVLRQLLARRARAHRRGARRPRPPPPRQDDRQGRTAQSDAGAQSRLSPGGPKLSDPRRMMEP